jgi:hypothetical protein
MSGDSLKTRHSSLGDSMKKVFLHLKMEMKLATSHGVHVKITYYLI